VPRQARQQQGDGRIERAQRLVAQRIGCGHQRQALHDRQRARYREQQCRARRRLAARIRRGAGAQGGAHRRLPRGRYCGTADRLRSIGIVRAVRAFAATMPRRR
jgi:hypothetical protein